MPTSSLLVAPTVIAHVCEVAPRTILDVGPGHGKYAVLFREYVPTVEEVHACEGWEPYVYDFNLGCLYESIYVQDVMTLGDEQLNRYDMVYLGDIIEHLSKEDGVALLDRIKKPVVICTPEHFFHNPDGLPWTETHRSHWVKQDFVETGRLTKWDVVHAGLVATLAAVAE